MRIHVANLIMQVIKNEEVTLSTFAKQNKLSLRTFQHVMIGGIPQLATLYKIIIATNIPPEKMMEAFHQDNIISMNQLLWEGGKDEI